MSDLMLARILEAALILFARHGFQRTSMADIAREAGIARATLYLRFSDKRALFGALAAFVVDQALRDAEAAWIDGAPLSDNLAATLTAKDVAFFRLRNATPHGGELLTLDAALTRQHTLRLDAGFGALLERRGAELACAGADLSAFGGADGFAALVTAAGSGLKHELRDEAAWRAAVLRFCTVVARATRPDPSAAVR